jgi:uncharacterized secreted repeat protein (TIGR03808 family)
MTGAAPHKICAPPRGLSRRRFFALAASVAAAPAARAAPDAANELSQALRAAAARGAAVTLPPGVTATRGLVLPEGARLVGVPGRSVLKLIGAGPLLQSAGAQKIALEGVIFDGGDGLTPKERGLLDFSDALSLAIHGCVIRRASTRGINLLRCAGRIAQTEIFEIGDAGFHSLDGFGVDFDGNHVKGCGDNGVMVWTTVAGRHEGSRLRNNVIEDIHNRSGGNGPYGNGVSIWGSGGVRVENNKIRRCVYTAVRNNAGHDVQVIGNECSGFQERAMYAEFGAKRSLFRDNLIDDASAGIGVANADRGTDGALVVGNRITNLREHHPDKDFGPSMLWLTAIEAEKNAQVMGNTIVGGWIGIAAGGWRENLRIESNDIRDVDYGVTVAVGEGVGDAVVRRNKIRARKAAVAARAGETILPGELARDARAFPRLSVEANDAISD